MRNSIRTCLLAGVLSLGAAQPLASAQSQSFRDRPPTPSTAEKPPTLRNYLLLVLITAGVIGVNAIPSKRGHQD